MKNKTILHCPNNSRIQKKNIKKTRQNLETSTNRDRRGGDCMVVGFTTTYAISAYHH